MHEHATVVYHVLVHHRPVCVIHHLHSRRKKSIVHPDVAEDVRDLVGGENVREYLP